MTSECEVERFTHVSKYRKPGSFPGHSSGLPQERKLREGCPEITGSQRIIIAPLLLRANIHCCLLSAGHGLC